MTYKDRGEYKLFCEKLVKEKGEKIRQWIKDPTTPEEMKIAFREVLQVAG